MPAASPGLGGYGCVGGTGVPRIRRLRLQPGSASAALNLCLFLWPWALPRKLPRPPQPLSAPQHRWSPVSPPSPPRRRLGMSLLPEQKLTKGAGRRPSLPQGQSAPDSDPHSTHPTARAARGRVASGQGAQRRQRQGLLSVEDPGRRAGAVGRGCALSTQGAGSGRSLLGHGREGRAEEESVRPAQTPGRCVRIPALSALPCSAGLLFLAAWLPAPLLPTPQPARRTGSPSARGPAGPPSVLCPDRYPSPSRYL